MTKQSDQAISLLQFAHQKRMEQRRANCPICRLPEEIRAEIRSGRSRDTERRLIIEWLGMRGHKVTDLDFQGHYAGHHEERDAEAPQ